MKNNVPFDYIPAKPFPAYHWLWATKTPMEGLNDPAVLFGVLRIIDSLADRGIKHSSSQFSEQLIELSKDVETNIKLEEQTGERDLLRGFGQYWSVLNLIPTGHRDGVIRITDLGKKIVSGEISQGDFAASTIATFTLPNKVTYTQKEIDEWKRHKLEIHPLRLILEVLQCLHKMGEGWITPEELCTVVLPMAADKKPANEMASYVFRYRETSEAFSDWPDCVNRSNDKRYIKEFLKFLSNYGYVQSVTDERSANNGSQRYEYIPELEGVITNLIAGEIAEIANVHANPLEEILQHNISSIVTSAVSGRRAQRAGQSRFRDQLLTEIGSCPITNVDMPEVLEAAHIKPHAHGGGETLDNGWPMRVDIHRLFDSGLLRIRPDGRYGILEFQNQEVAANYLPLKNKIIRIPECTNLEFVRWRYDNYQIGMNLND